MSTVDWTTLRKLVEAARQIASSDRLAFLKRECGDQQALLGEALSLLKYEERADSFLEPPEPGRVAPFFREHEAAGYVGKIIGPFEITGLLGFGGMGLVLRARQSNPPREVALKIVRGGSFVDKRQLRLFEREIRSLARLSHPAVASLYEAGSTEDGQHYFAMELVQGLPLLDYANEHQLDLRARLSLFARVCDAVHYAHQKGVIHRDIKPSNILVAHGGQPKLLDFGLSKLTEQDSASVSTAPSKVQGTLSYMSPEQARGSNTEIDIRSDVYSLGVVLFELLTQSRPFDLTHRTVPQAIDVICEVTPPKAGTLLPALRGDVETIVAKALEKEPERRYQSAHALAEDVYRFLAGQPIAARPPSATYQFRKFAVRHKLPVAFAAILVLVISISAVVATVLSMHLARERDAALAAKVLETEARQSSEQVVEFLVRLFEHGDPEAEEKSVPTVHQLLDAGVTRVQTELADQPLVQARLMTAMGSVFLALGEYDRSRELLEAGLSIRERQLGVEHIDVAESLFALNELCVNTGDLDRGYELAKRGLEIRRKKYDEDHPRYADTLELLGRNRFYANDFAKAAEYFRGCLKTRTILYGEHNLEVADALQNLGLTLQKLNALEEAETLLRRALSIQRSLHSDALKIVLSLDALAQVVYTRGDYLSTERLMKEEFDFARENLHEKHPHVAWALDHYATLVRRNHGPEQAEPLYREAVARYRTALGNEHIFVARELMALGSVRKQLNEYVEAELCLAEALKIRRARLRSSHQAIAESARELGLVIESNGRFEEAATLLRESYDIYSSALGTNDAKSLDVARDIEKLYLDSNNSEEAEIWREKSSSVPTAAAKSD